MISDCLGEGVGDCLALLSAAFASVGWDPDERRRRGELAVGHGDVA